MDRFWGDVVRDCILILALAFCVFQVRACSVQIHQASVQCIDQAQTDAAAKACA